MFSDEGENQLQHNTTDLLLFIMTENSLEFNEQSQKGIEWSPVFLYLFYLIYNLFLATSSHAFIVEIKSSNSLPAKLFFSLFSFDIRVILLHVTGQLEVTIILVITVTTRIHQTSFNINVSFLKSMFIPTMPFKISCSSRI